MGSTDFWNNQESAQGIVQQVKALKMWVEPFEALIDRVRSTRELFDLLEVEADAEMEAELGAEIERIGGGLEEFRLRSLLSEPADFVGAQTEHRAGAERREAEEVGAGAERR